MKRFYKTVTVEPGDEGFMVALDGRLVKTPARGPLSLPTRGLADAIAAEWVAQGEDVKPDSMPIIKLANTALDRVRDRHADVVAEVATYAETDLLCYRADEPAELIEEQQKHWDPYIIWAASTFGITLQVTNGIMPVRQDEAAIAALTEAVAAHDPFELTALHAFTTGFGSVVLGLALMRGFTSFDAVWRASLVDAEYQERQWGLDWETEDKRNRLKADLDAAWQFLSQVRNK